MADVTAAFEASPVVDGDQTAFVEAVVGIGETTIELDLAGEVRLAAIAFESGFAGTSIAVAAVVPWAAGDANQTIADFTIDVNADGVTKVNFYDSFYLSKILLTVDAGQSAAKKIGFFGWRGDIQ